MDDAYRNPGPLQYDGAGADAKPVTLCVEDQDYMGMRETTTRIHQNCSSLFRSTKNPLPLRQYIKVSIEELPGVDGLTCPIPLHANRIFGPYLK